ncbi:MAG: sodium-dependent transporter [Bacteroidota bacterium]|jgi:SNF family Na+-dependent transporter
MAVKSERWGSRIGLILAVAGNAVGLGNFLRFPAQAVKNGGGAFIIPYLVSFLVMGIPLLWIEWTIGRYGGLYGFHATPGAMHVMGKRWWWKYVGVFGIFTNLTVAAYYAFIESWTLGFVWYSLSGAFTGLSPDQINGFFSWYLGITGNTGLFTLSPPAITFFFITISLNIWILSRGLQGGVEKASKIGMPLLLLFGIFLAIRALTLHAGEQGAVNDAALGLNFLWNPQFDSLANPNVWLAAAGQIFFTLSVGMGSIHCYAAYLRANEDIALNAATAGWMNEFVEIVLGGTIIVPIAAAYLGLDWLQEHVGFEMGFRTMPMLFQNWGPVLAVVAGVAWFGLLFFAGITSSLAMGQPILAFLEDEFSIERRRAALYFGGAVLLLSLPCVLLYSAGAFEEFDFWAGTFSLVVFALAEVILFGWVFGIKNGWEELTRGADIHVPVIFRFVIKYVTPVFLLAVFFGALLKPASGNWSTSVLSLMKGEGWSFAPDSVIGSLLHVGVVDTRWIVDGQVTHIAIVDGTRVLLLCTFLAIAALVFFAFRKHRNHTFTREES